MQERRMRSDTAVAATRDHQRGAAPARVRRPVPRHAAHRGSAPVSHEPPSRGRRPATVPRRALLADRRPCAADARPARTRPERPSAQERRRHRARRSATIGAFAILFATCAVWVQGGGGRTGSGPLAAPGTGRTETVAARVWVVQPGDTLWGIAHRLQPTGDIRPLVDALSREVHGKPLEVGEQLPLP